MLVRLIAILAVVLTLRPAAAQPITPIELERQLNRAWEREAYAEAAVLIEKYLENAPNDVNMIYNLACAKTRLGLHDEAASALYRAVKAGFRDFDFMAADPDLLPLHEHELFQAILEAAETVDRTRSDDVLDGWRATYGDEDYRYETDRDRRLAYATALDAVSHREMRRMLELQADQMVSTLFDEPPAYYVLIAVPSTEHAQRLFPELRMGGVYQHGQRRLVARDIGNALRHEFFHAYHYGHMSRIGQMHPIAIQEGLATLYEDYEFSEDGQIVFLPNDRHNVVKNTARAGRLMKWPQLFELGPDEFMSRAGTLYPQVRSVFEYVADEGLLSEWYDAYVETFREDPAGIVAFEIVFHKSISAIQSDYRSWLNRRPKVDNQIDPGDASLGITSTLRSGNDGVVVDRVLPRSAADAAGIRRNDVIVSIDGTATRTFTELVGVIGKRQVGERVQVRFRRGDRYFTVEARLRPR